MLGKGMMQSFWKIWINAGDAVKAERVMSQCQERMGVTCFGNSIEPYSKGGFVGSSTVDVDTNDWNTFVISVIRIGQRIGTSWILSGEIDCQCDGWSNDCLIPGTTASQWICDKITKD